MNLTKFEKVLNLLPDRWFKCQCGKTFTLERGKARYSKRMYNGPYCHSCGAKISK